MNKPPTTLVEAYIETKREIDILEEKLKILSETIKTFGTITSNGETGSVTVSQVAGRRTTDWKALAANLDIPKTTIDQFTKVGEPSYRLTVGALQ